MHVSACVYMCVNTCKAANNCLKVVITDFTDGPCQSQPCMNGGTCYDRDDLHNCRCSDGFEGNNCETKSRKFVTTKHLKNNNNSIS